MIRKALSQDLPQITQLACRLWPEHAPSDLLEEMSVLFNQGKVVFFLALEEDTAVGFAQCQLRYDYVEGTDSSPVGYLEGIYVKEEHRAQGIAKALVAACEDWARNQGCREFASDCELDNEQSLRFHLKAGFREANRIICFTKAL